MRLEDNMVAIKFSTTNDAFSVPGPEIARILRRLAEIAEQGITQHRIMDANGNTVGTFNYKQEEE